MGGIGSQNNNYSPFNYNNFGMEGQPYKRSGQNVSLPEEKSRSKKGLSKRRSLKPILGGGGAGHIFTQRFFKWKKKIDYKL